jgi:hypothetical protein
MTVSSWVVVGLNSIFLSTATEEGYISGHVNDVLGMVISPPVTVMASGESVTTDSRGGYLLRLTSGIYTVTANPNNLLSGYVSQDQTGILVNLGQVVSNLKFILSQGGKFRGFVTRDGINALSGVAVGAFDSNKAIRAQDVSDSAGNFLLVNLSTGSYNVEPILDSGEVSSPVSRSATIIAGGDTHVGMFTITGAIGKVKGSVSAFGNLVKTGALIVASTTSVGGGPPAISSSSLSGAAYYAVSSTEEGLYTLEVRGSTSTTYNIYAYHTTFNGTTPTILVSSGTGISVLSGQTVNGINFSW